MLQWLFSSRVQRVYARSDRGVLESKGVNTEDFFATTLEFASGATALLENSWILPASHPSISTCRCRIVGTRGMVKIDAANNGGMSYSTNEGAPVDVSLFGLNQIDGRFQGSPERSIHHFVRCVLGGEQPIVTLEDALSSVEVIRAILRSAREGRPIDVH